MTLFVVRHAHAGQRSRWTGEDHERPLSARGQSQAAQLADVLASADPVRILSAPAVRCAQTVEPLAARTGVPVAVDVRIAEGASSAGIAELEQELRTSGEVVVACSHGDVIPLLLDRLLAHGMRPSRDLVWQKASTWTIERDGDGWGAASYAPPPDR